MTSPTATVNLDRPGARGAGARADDHDHYTQWVLDRFSDDLILRYPLSERAGASDFVDVAGSHDASIEGAWTLGETSIVWDGPTSAAPDGSTGYAAAGDISALDFGDTEAFSLEMWVRTSTNFGRMFSKFDPNTAAGGWNWYLDGNGKSNLYISDGTDDTFNPANTDVTDGEIHHVAVTHDASETITLYVDGGVDGTGGSGSVGDLSSSTNLQIGRRADGSGYFDGALGGGGIYDRALSDDEVQRLYERGAI